MKRIRLQEGRRSSERKVIYEGNGFCRVMKGGKLVERLQLEKGDNLLEALKGGKLMEGSFKPMNGPSYGPKGYWETSDGDFYLGSEDGEWFIYLEGESGDTVWTAYFDAEEYAKFAGDKAAKSSNPTKVIQEYAIDFIEN